MRYAIFLLFLYPLILVGEQQFKMEYEGGLIWLKATSLRHNQELSFILDSGAQVSVIDLGKARELKIPKGHLVNACGIGGCAVGYWPMTLELKVEDVAVTKKCLGLDLGDFSKACGRPVDGLIGADFFQNKIVQIDYAASTVKILDRFPPTSSGLTLPMKKTTGGFLVKAEVAGINDWFRVDTGSSLARFVTANLQSFPKRVQKITIGLAALPAEVVKTEWHMGGSNLGEFDTILHKAPIFRGERGLLGNNLLSQFTVILDGSGSRILLEKTASN